MEDSKSYYECKRCFFTCYQKCTMKKHLDKVKTCERKLESFQYNDNELYNLSLLRINSIKKDTFCDLCKKEFKNIFSLKRHQNKIHENNVNDNLNDNVNNNINHIDNVNYNDNDNVNYNDNDNNINDNINCITNNGIINNGNINIVNNSNNNNISINIINFDDNWNTSHIDDKQKILLLLKKFKFTSTLENILENEVNLNVLIDNTTENGLICNDNKFEKMNIKDIVNKTMKKLLDSLNNFKNEIYEKNEHNLDLYIIENEINKANIKYEDFKKNKISQNDVNHMIKNIYNKRKDDTYNICKSSGY